MFTHLHAHSHYSLLDGLGTVDEIVRRAKETKAPAACVTDHGSVSAYPDLLKSCKEHGIKPVIGCEFYVVDSITEAPTRGEKRYHLTVIAKSWEGFQSIMRSLTLANRQFYFKPRLSLDQALDFEDCIVMSGCVKGILSHEQWEKVAKSFRARYGEDFYLEIQPHQVRDTPESTDIQRMVNVRAFTLWKSQGFKVVATNDAHYVWADDAHPHEVLLAIQTKKTWDNPKRMRFCCDGFHMRDLSEMIAAFSKFCDYLPGKMVKEALMASLEVVKRVNVEKPDLPIAIPSPYERDDLEVFGEKIREGWAQKIESKVSDPNVYAKRLVYEIGVIRRLGFTRYFLVVEDMIRWAREQNIMVGPGRGSAAGSLVCYLLDITRLDPIEHGLVFERFLNPLRIDFPDIDSDFEKERRVEVLEYMREKYGHDYTAQITTFGELTLKVAFKDVARVFRVDNLLATNLAKQLEEEKDFEEVPELARFVKTEQGASIMALAKKLSGRIRQNGVHAAGVIISSKPITDVAAIERRGDEHKNVVEVINWDMRQCEAFGLIKMDILGLATLTILARAADWVKRTKGEEIDYTEIPLDDDLAMKAFARGDTTGVFQFENSGMQGLLKSLKASDFTTITATTALYRPGPLNSGLTERFVQIAQGNEFEKYPSERLRPILSPTRSVLIYQEQLMNIAVELAGFTWAEADKLRKVVGKKLGRDEFEKHRDHFVEGCLKNGVDGSIANTVFSQMAEFAGYGFNLSHAAAYSLISVLCQFMKQHHPEEFVTACLTTTLGDGSDKKRDKKLALLMRDCRSRGIEVLQPDINTSTNDYEIERDGSGKLAIRAPLRVIKGVGPAVIASILEERGKSGVFLSQTDFEDRVNRRLAHVGIRTLLVRAGAFETLGVRERDDEKRVKNFCELMPSFALVPQLAMGDRMIKEQLDMLGSLFAEVTTCQALNKPKGSILLPKLKQKSTIFVVNNPVKNELTHWTSDGSKFFVKTMKSLGFTEGDFYYTSPIKCVHDNYNKVNDACSLRCAEFLKREIELVRPKLIICFASNAAGTLLGDPKAQAGKLRGQVIYSKPFGTYVLFAPSPQYAYWRDEAREPFLEAMNLVRQIFS